MELLLSVQAFRLLSSLEFHKQFLSLEFPTAYWYSEFDLPCLQCLSPSLPPSISLSSVQVRTRV